MTGLSHGKRLGEISGPFFSPSELSVSHNASFTSFWRKY